MATDPKDPTQSERREVVDFTLYRNKNLIDVLKAALKDAEAGRVDGAILVLQREGRNHGVTVVGSYEGDARRVAGIAGEIFVEFMPQTLGRPVIIRR